MERKPMLDIFWVVQLEFSRADYILLVGRSASAAHHYLLARPSRDPRLAAAPQYGTCGSYRPISIVEDAKGANAELVQRSHGAGVASPVPFEKILTAASVVRLLFKVFETV